MKSKHEVQKIILEAHKTNYKRMPLVGAAKVADVERVLFNLEFDIFGSTTMAGEAFDWFNEENRKREKENAARKK